MPGKHQGQHQIEQHLVADRLVVVSIASVDEVLQEVIILFGMGAALVQDGLQDRRHTRPGPVAPPELWQRQARRQDRVKATAKVRIEVPELAPGLGLEAVAHQRAAGHILGQPAHRLDDLEFARLA